VTLYNKNFVTTPSRVTYDESYPEWYLPPDYTLFWDVGNSTNYDKMIEDEEFCYFVSDDKEIDESHCPTNDTNIELELLGRASNPSQYLVTGEPAEKEFFVFKAKFQWDQPSGAKSLTFLRDVYNFSKVDEERNRLKSGQKAFYDATNLKKVYAFTHNGFSVTNLTLMDYMFQNASNFDQDISNFITTSATDMSGMFQNASVFNQSVNFNTASVTDMKSMFYGAEEFNQSLDDFDTSEVTDMSSMFNNATAFNQSLNDFDTSKVTNMDQMFRDATVFDQDITDWCVPNIVSKPSGFDTNSGFENQFWHQPRWGVLCEDLIISTKHYIVSSRTITDSDLPAKNGVVDSLTPLGSQNGEFLWASEFEWDNSAWRSLSWLLDVRKFASNKITNGKLAFVNSPATHFTALPDLDTRDLTNMEKMFYVCENFNQSINFDARNVTDMNNMFSQAYEFNSPLILTNTGSVTNMNAMFYGTIAFNQPLNFDTSSVNDMNLMFVGARAFDQDISDWCVSQILSKPADFDTGAAFEDQPWYQPRWGVDCVDKEYHYFVSSINNLEDDNLPASSVSGLTNLGSTNGGYLYKAKFDWKQPNILRSLTWLVDVRQFGDNKIISGKFAFYDLPATQLTALPDLDTSDVTDMGNMFSEATNFNQSLSNFDTSSVINMNQIFFSASSFNQPLDDFDTTLLSGNDLNGAFWNASSFNQDISMWCVDNIGSKPPNFDTGSGFAGQTTKQPQWGQPC